MIADQSGLSDEARQEVQSTLTAAESRLTVIRNEIKTMEFRYQDLLSQEKVAENQLWLARLLLTGDEGAIAKSPESTSAQDQYGGKTIAAAAEQMIKEKGRMLSARGIADTLTKDGRVFASRDNAVASIVTSIKRHPETFFWTNIGGVNHFGLIGTGEEVE